jgi:Protein of unknown function (DUF3096)
MMRTVAHFLPFAALAGGILILLMPRLLNYVVAVYLILVGAIGLNNIYHFIRWELTCVAPCPVAGRFREDLCLDAAEIIENRAGYLTPIDPM